MCSNRNATRKGIPMTPREQRGLVIAALFKLKRSAECWLVPSQTGAERVYRVNVKAQTCTCPDHQEAGFKCKHLFAVEFTMQREVGSDGTVTDTESVTITHKKTYSQNWPAYNEAQCIEKHRFQELLFDLCDRIPERARDPHSVGRHPTLFHDQVFAICSKVYGTLSSRRSVCDLGDALNAGYLTRHMSWNQVIYALNDTSVTPVLESLIAKAAMPLRILETKFAVDSSGFGSDRRSRWFDEKYGMTRQRTTWTKVHVIVGVKTHIVTGVRILGKDAADCPQFSPLVKATAENFQIEEVSADKAYLSRENLGLVQSLGGTPFVPFKCDSVAGEPGSLWERMYHYYHFRQQDFLDHYHKRSNVESVFSAIKRKFGDSVRSRTDVAMVNECLAKILCHNICCVIASQIELGIEPMFWNKSNCDNPSILSFPTPA